MRRRWENSQIVGNLKINLLWKILRMCFPTILENLKHYNKIKISVTGNSHFSELFQNSHFVLGIPNIWFLEIKPGNFPKPVTQQQDYN